MRLQSFMEHECIFALGIILRKLSVVNTLNPYLSVIWYDLKYRRTCVFLSV
jgi:hypothetical protein